MTAKEKLLWMLVVVAAMAALVGAGYTIQRNYEECRAVPHTMFYCLTAGG